MKRLTILSNSQAEKGTDPYVTYMEKKKKKKINIASVTKKKKKSKHMQNRTIPQTAKTHT